MPDQTTKAETLSDPGAPCAPRTCVKQSTLWPGTPNLHCTLLSKSQCKLLGPWVFEEMSLEVPEMQFSFGVFVLWKIPFHPVGPRPQRRCEILIISSAQKATWKIPIIRNQTMPPRTTARAAGGSSTQPARHAVTPCHRMQQRRPLSQRARRSVGSRRGRGGGMGEVPGRPMKVRT